ncbi:MAG: DUF6456 domain-containing protein [Rhodoplanes sp.]
MTRANRKGAGQATDRMLSHLATAGKPDGRGRRRPAEPDPDAMAELAAADLVARSPDGEFELTAAGRARLARFAATKAGGDIDVFRAQHLALARRGARRSAKQAEPSAVVVNDAESPLAWLARRKGRDGRPMIEPVQFLAGERLRADFTFAQLMPRMTVDWASPIAGGSGAAAGGPAAMAETVVAARQRLKHALDAAGPEFAGLLVDVCCFLKGIEDVERERGWPPRSAKVVLQLGLDRLVRHYGLAAEARGRGRAPVRTWLAPGERFVSADGDVTG